MKGSCIYFPVRSRTTSSVNHDKKILLNGIDYNTAESKNVKQVDAVQTLSEAHSVPKSGTPNSVARNYRNGLLNSERYFGEDGMPYLDIDYTDHGNPSTHKTVPHEHKISFDSNGKMKRGKEE